MGTESRQRKAARCRRGQALAELAVGMVAVALVLAGLLGFIRCILGGLDAQRSMRAEAGREALGANGPRGSFALASRHFEVEVSPLAADWVFGSETVKLEEKVYIPHTGVYEQ